MVRYLNQTKSKNLYFNNARSLSSTQPPIGITGMPFTRNCVLDTMTRSPAFSPEVTA